MHQGAASDPASVHYLPLPHSCPLLHQAAASAPAGASPETPETSTPMFKLRPTPATPGGGHQTSSGGGGGVGVGDNELAEALRLRQERQQQQ
jgi:hypothetical protein